MYSQVITRCHRTAFVIAVDQSSSMQGETTVDGRRMSKAEAVALITNSILEELLLRASHSSGLRNYYDVAVIGYADERVYSLIEGEEGFLPITSLAQKPVEYAEWQAEHTLPSGETVCITERIPQWVHPSAAGSTPMYEMLDTVAEMVEGWCREPQNHESFPPMVFNITDGEPTDCDYNSLRSAASRLRSASTADGETLLVNIHLSAEAKSQLVFPRAEEVISAGEYARLLADISSVMPEPFNQPILDLRGDHAPPPFVAMSYNASIVDGFSMLNIGSYSVTNLQ